MSSTRARWLTQPLQQKSLWYLAAYMGILLLVMVSSSLGFSSLPSAPQQKSDWLLLPLQAALTMTTCLLALSARIRANAGLYLGFLLGSIAVLGGYLFEAGGHTNPVISLLLVPLAISAALLGWQATALVALTVLLLYTVLTQYFIPLDGGGEHHHHFMQLHLVGMWITFALSVLLILGLVLPLAMSVQRQQALINKQREQMLQDEKLIAMATFAASAAHQLGTPLATLAVLVGDLQDTMQETGVQEDLALMKEQIQICKSTLYDMMRKAERPRHEAGQTSTVTALVHALQQQFNLLHPARALELTDSALPESRIECDDTLIQALLNLLDNAVRACQENPRLDVTQEGSRLRLRIYDQGPGLPAEVERNVGTPFLRSSHPGAGLGLGLFLSNATINRLGGTLQLISTSDGTLTEVWLPVAAEARAQGTTS